MKCKLMCSWHIKREKREKISFVSDSWNRKAFLLMFTRQLHADFYDHKIVVKFHSLCSACEITSNKEKGKKYVNLRDENHLSLSQIDIMQFFINSQFFTVNNQLGFWMMWISRGVNFYIIFISYIFYCKKYLRDTLQKFNTQILKSTLEPS